MRGGCTGGAIVVGVAGAAGVGGFVAVVVGVVVVGVVVVVGLVVDAAAVAGVVLALDELGAVVPLAEPDAPPEVADVAPEPAPLALDPVVLVPLEEPVPVPDWVPDGEVVPLPC